MDNLSKFYIDGVWVTPKSDQRFPVLNPATEQRVGEIILGNSDDVNLAVTAANRAFESFSRTSKEQRLEFLDRLLEVTKSRLEDLAQAITLEMGAPISMSREAQADAAVGHLVGYIEALKAQQQRSLLANGDTHLYEPIGVCGLITPWNWPVNQVSL